MGAPIAQEECVAGTYDCSTQGRGTRQLREAPSPRCPVRPRSLTCSHAKVSTFHTRAVWSSEVVMAQLPPGSTDTRFRRPEWPDRVARQRPRSASQMRAVESWGARPEEAGFSQVHPTSQVVRVIVQSRVPVKGIPPTK